jgi:transaldolase
LIKLFADVKSIDEIEKFNQNDLVCGFTTNPTLVRNGGYSSYQEFITLALKSVNNKPISIEVIADELDEMFKQAIFLKSLSNNIYVKIPITNTSSQSTIELVGNLLNLNVNVNLTAVFLPNQLEGLEKYISKKSNLIISVFAGRIADTLKDPVPIVKEIINKFKGFEQVEVLWASPREILNLRHAEDIGCHIITATPDLLDKLALKDKDLEEFSLDTVKMFFDDALKANFTLGIGK